MGANGHGGRDVGPDLPRLASAAGLGLHLKATTQWLENAQIGDYWIAAPTRRPIPLALDLLSLLVSEVGFERRIYHLQSWDARHQYPVPAPEVPRVSSE